MPRRYGPVPSRTDHPLYPQIRACTACSLFRDCKGPVPPVGPAPARVMVLLEAPGANEDAWGIPVTGATWDELEPLLHLADLSRDTVWLSNVLMCRPLGDPTLADAEVCFDRWKPLEIALVRPAVVVVAGQLAIQRVLGDPTLTVAEVRGYPIWHPPWDCWLLPTYHPAAVLYNDAYRVALREDFTNLGRLKMGETWTRPVDEYPDPVYRRGLPPWL